VADPEKITKIMTDAASVLDGISSGEPHTHDVQLGHPEA
jgi:hypothetical protein